MIETFYGLARLGHTDGKGMRYPLQLALCVEEFCDVIVFRSPPVVVQRAIFGALAPIARLARLPRNVPTAFADRAGAEDLAKVSEGRLVVGACAKALAAQNLSEGSMSDMAVYRQFRAKFRVARPLDRHRDLPYSFVKLKVASRN